MADNDKQIALWILSALKTEQGREPSLDKCKNQAELLQPLKASHNLTDADLKRGVKFLNERGLLQTDVQTRGIVMLPSLDGLNYFEIESRLGDRKTRVKREIIYAVCGLVLTYIAAMIIKVLPH